MIKDDDGVVFHIRWVKLAVKKRVPAVGDDEGDVVLKKSEDEEFVSSPGVSHRNLMSCRITRTTDSSQN